MSQDSKVIIIDDDKMSSHNWSVLLKFVGEEPVSLNDKKWQQELLNIEGSKENLLFIIGDQSADNGDSEQLLEKIKAIHDLNINSPILLDAEGFDLNVLSSKSRALVFKLPNEPTYQSLLEVLEKARALKGLGHSLPESKLISKSGTAMFRSLVGDSELMRNTRDLMHQVADKLVNVLVLGESGTGKEIMARNLHYHSGRGEKPFVIVNCATVSDELFGCVEGFKGTTENHIGLMEKADQGTLFLDCINDMTLETQAKIMRFLDHQGFQPLGSSETLHPDVRVVAATNQDLEEKIKQGLFREDLYYRLSVVPITVPALRDHVEDIPELVGELISRLEHQVEVSVRFNSSALASLKLHLWPGNVRELANLVERLSIIQTNEVVGFNDLPLEYQHENLSSNTEEINSENTDELGDLDGELSLESEANEAGAEKELQTFQPVNAQALKEYLLKSEKHLVQVALSDCASLQDFTAERLGVTGKELSDLMTKHKLES